MAQLCGQVAMSTPYPITALGLIQVALTLEQQESPQAGPNPGKTLMIDHSWGHRILFLPGAAGAGDFWRPAAEQLPFPCETVFFDWPGLGTVPADAHIGSLDDLVALVLTQLDRPVDLVAQSIGGVIAVHAALARPRMVRRLVLSATSGGVDVSRFRAFDWRPEYRKVYPSALRGSPRYDADLSKDIRTIYSPTLLLWGDLDPISPVAISLHPSSLDGRGGQRRRRDAACLRREIAVHRREGFDRTRIRGATSLEGSAMARKSGSSANTNARTQYRIKPREVTEEQIRLRAYEIYLEREGTPGSALEDWLRAERELQS